MKAEEVIRKLRRDGWVEVRQKGSHKIFKHPQKAGHVTVPFHKGRDMSTGTLSDIMKKAGIRVMTMIFFLS